MLDQNSTLERSAIFWRRNFICIFGSQISNKEWKFQIRVRQAKMIQQKMSLDSKHDSLLHVRVIVVLNGLAQAARQGNRYPMASRNSRRHDRMRTADGGRKNLPP